MKTLKQAQEEIIVKIKEWQSLKLYI